jgi:5-guanidino-2-oxopentanoate decarboxylase
MGALSVGFALLYSPVPAGSMRRASELLFSRWMTINAHFDAMVRELLAGGLRLITTWPCIVEASYLLENGYARATGKPGVCTIIGGPGVTNAATGIAQAYCDSQPMMVLSGATATGTHGKGWGAIHELDDQQAITKGITALSAMVRHPEEFPEWVARAFGIFRSTRPRPVHLSLPRDILPTQVAAAWRARRAPSRPMPDPAFISEAAARLAQARHPIIFVGGGAVGTRASLADIAERIGAPVLSSNAGKGILPESHPLSLGCSVLQYASRLALAEADVVLLVGSEVAAGDHFLPKLEISGAIIRIDIDSDELSSLYASAIPIQADAGAALAALADALARRTPAPMRAEGEERVRKILAANKAALTNLERLHQRAWQILRAALPIDTIIMGDMTQIVYTGCFAMPMEVERCWYYSGNYCALGVALPMAIGAKIGAPHRPVIAVAGDGGFMFTVNELATAAEEGLALPVIVWNNNALNAIVEGMDLQKIPRIGVEPKSPDFPKLAESLGCHGCRPASADQLSQAVRAALAADRPTLIEIRQDATWLSD